ncbi:MAG TPA: Minf_1886 family protein [Candidatus Saccharimonadales bacterium]|nr:Minf_1886 family protein [Candidatus Saccharimonadales bacterium]
MPSLTFEDAVRKIVASDSRYEFEGYLFVHEAIQYTQKALGRHKQEEKHVGCKELLNGIRDYALTTFGPMTTTVLDAWGIHSCEDFGEIVFNLIQHNQAIQSNADRREDFKNGYAFDDAFRKPFLPSQSRGKDSKPAHTKMIGQG